MSRIISYVMISSVWLCNDAKRSAGYKLYLGSYCKHILVHSLTVMFIWKFVMRPTFFACLKLNQQKPSTAQLAIHHPPPGEFIGPMWCSAFWLQNKTPQLFLCFLWSCSTNFQPSICIFLLNRQSCFVKRPIFPAVKYFLKWFNPMTAPPLSSTCLHQHLPSPTAYSKYLFFASKGKSNINAAKPYRHRWVGVSRNWCFQVHKIFDNNDFKLAFPLLAIRIDLYEMQLEIKIKWSTVFKQKNKTREVKT